jgi:hypothetical protein
VLRPTCEVVVVIDQIDLALQNVHQTLWKAERKIDPNNAVAQCALLREAVKYLADVVEHNVNAVRQLDARMDALD